MSPYLRGLRQSIIEAVSYPLDFFIGMLQITALIGVNVIIWTYIIPADPATLNNRIAYFMLANGLAAVTGGARYKFANILIEHIKDGTLTHYLLKPISPVLLILSEQMGERFPDFIAGIIFISISLFFSTPPSWIQLLLFLLSIISAYIITASLNVIVGSLAFWTTEADGIKNAFNHVTRLFNGQMIPLEIFIKIIGPMFSIFIYVLPFSATAFVPAHIYLSKSLSEINMYFIISCVTWTVVSPVFAYLIWKKGLKKYEGTGI